MIRQRFKALEMLLQILFFLQQTTQVFTVAAEQSIAVFGPGKKRRIVEQMNTDAGRTANHLAGPFRRIFRDDDRQFRVTIQNLVKIIESFDSRKTVLGIFAEKRHEAAVPDPDIGVAESFVHIRGLRHAGQIDDMVVRQFPGFPIKLNEFRMGIANRDRNPGTPFRGRIEILFHDGKYPIIS